MSYCNSREEIQRLMKSSQIFQRAMERAKERDAYWKAHFADDQARLSGWGHNFVCPACASTMQMKEHYQPGGEYICPNCGERASGRLLDEAWVYMYRYRSAEALLDAALNAHVNDDETSLEYIIRYVDFYADHYEEFPVHGEHAGKGKVMGQSLDEAVWALMLLRALQVCGRERFTQEKRAEWAEKLFEPLAELILGQAGRIHNIPLWLRCAAGVIGIFFENEQLLTRALEGEFGIRNQVNKGYTEDGLWYECSMHYHYYSTEGLTEFLSAYHEVCPEDALFEVAMKAYSAPGKLSADGWRVPSLNDGWYPIDIGRYMPQIMRMHRILPAAETGAQLRRICERKPELLENALSLLFVRGNVIDCPDPVYDEVSLFPATCLAVLNKPMHVLLKSGVLTTSHMHMDCMAITMAPFSEDLGTPGYGHPLTRIYYDQTLSHNTFLMDGMTQPRRPVVGCVAAVEGGVRGVADEVYDGVRCSRTLTAEGDILRDVMHIEADSSHCFHWVFHSDGSAELPEDGVDAELTGNEESYGLLKNVRVYDSTKPFEAQFALDGKKLTVSIPVETLKNARVYTASVPGNPADHLLTAILLRAEGADVVFEARYQMI